MDIVSNIPFDLKLIQYFPEYKENVGNKFSFDEEYIWVEDICTLSAEENDEIEILFDSNDKEARLYLEALDIMPIDDYSIAEDEFGHLYRKASSKSFKLYSSNENYDTLRVGAYKISIYCYDKWYYGVFEILPKPISKNEWQMMKDDLEKEIDGLTKDIVRGNIGIGEYKDTNIPTKIIYDFMVIKNYSNKVIMSLMDIAENPRYEIRTEYENVLAMQVDKYRFDKETMRRYASKSGTEPTYKVPVKKTCYDIQENRLLKDMLQEYDKKLVAFIKLIREAEKIAKSTNYGSSVQYRNSWINSIQEFKEIAYKLKKITAIIKTKDWFLSIGNLNEPHIPHSFILDTRYNTIYQMHMALKNDTMSIQLSSKFSYTWKQSSYLYEMWCFIKICHFCLEEYKMDYNDWNFQLSKKIIFPFLKEGTKIRFYNNYTRLDVIYDRCLPLDSKITDINNPLYIAKQHGLRNHNRPDILINVYESNIYIGSIILECKYRKLNSFWNKNSPRTSIEQLQAYYNNSRSTVLLDGMGNEFSMRAVSKVFALSPDDLAEGSREDDFEIQVKTFKASQDKASEELVKKAIFDEIYNLKDRYEKIKNSIIN